MLGFWSGRDGGEMATVKVVKKHVLVLNQEISEGGGGGVANWFERNSERCTSTTYLKFPLTVISGSALGANA